MTNNAHTKSKFASRFKKRRPASASGRLLVAVLLSIALAATACGGGGATGGASADNGPSTAGDSSAQVGTLANTRPGQGIKAAGGDPMGGGDCSDMAEGESSPQRFKIAWIEPDLENLAQLGLEVLDLEHLNLIMQSYINEINRHGGVNGNCFEALTYVWDVAMAESEITRICTELPQQQPLAVMSLRMSDILFNCLTLAGGIPTISINSSQSEANFVNSGGLLFDDRGSSEYQFNGSLITALDVGEIGPSDRVALLYTQPTDPANDRSADEIAEIDTFAESLGIRIESNVPMPEGYSGIPLLILEEQKRRYEAGTIDTPVTEEQAGRLDQMDTFYETMANQMKTTGITAVVTNSDWSHTRRLMVAADPIDWFPTWIVNDIQTASLILGGAPKRQAVNLVQASSWRTPGDPLTGLDQGCHTLRNSLDVDPFAYQHHTDAWVLMMSMCDVLDVLFGAISKAGISLTRDSLVAALEETSFDALHGLHIGFGPNDRYGSDTMRALKADPDCALNQWGCLRPIPGTGWTEVSQSLSDNQAAQTEGSTGG